MTRMIWHLLVQYFIRYEAACQGLVEGNLSALPLARHLGPVRQHLTVCRAWLCQAALHHQLHRARWSCGASVLLWSQGFFSKYRH